MTVKEHLEKAWARSAEHHFSKAKAYRGLSKCFGGMKKAEGSDGPDPESIQEQLDALAEEEESMGDFCLECCAGVQKMSAGDLAKAFGMEGDGIVPDGVHIVIGEIPSNVVPVPRFGQRELSRAGVAEGLEKILGTDE